MERTHRPKGILSRFGKVAVALLVVAVGLLAIGERVFGQEIHVRAIRMDGSEILGVLQELNETDCIVQVSAEERMQISLDDLARLEVRDKLLPAPLPKVLVRLVDGSVIFAERVTASEGNMVIMGGSAEVMLETRNVAAVDYRRTHAAADSLPDAQSILPQELSSDVLVVRRQEDGVVGLNPVEGILVSLADSQVVFKFDDREIEVPLERVDSLFYYHPPGRRMSELEGTVTTQRGDRYLFRRWETVENGIAFQTQSGVDVTLAWTMIDQIDLEAGRVMSLVDLEPTTLEWNPFVPPRDADVQRLEQLRSLFAIERDRSFSGRPLSVFSASGFAGTRERLATYSRGLALRSSTRLAYRLPDGYSRLVGVLGIDPDVRPRGHVVVTIEGDGKSLWEGTLSGSDSEPVMIDLDIDGVSRLMVEIGFGEGGDLGDRVHWCEPRLVK